MVYLTLHSIERTSGVKEIRLAQCPAANPFAPHGVTSAV